jgi:hypothetical protein
LKGKTTVSPWVEFFISRENGFCKRFSWIDFWKGKISFVLHEFSRLVFFGRENNGFLQGFS